MAGQESNGLRILLIAAAFLGLHSTDGFLWHTCLIVHCNNGGRCQEDFSFPGLPVCNCLHGYTGDRCDIAPHLVATPKPIPIINTHRDTTVPSTTSTSAPTTQVASTTTTPPSITNGGFTHRPITSNVNTYVHTDDCIESSACLDPSTSQIACSNQNLAKLCPLTCGLCVSSSTTTPATTTHGGFTHRPLQSKRNTHRNTDRRK